MKAKIILAALLLLVAGLQTAWGQGFRVYKSDGTIMQFSLRTDSIVFYDGIGTDVDFGPFTPVNQCIVGTWYKSKSESVTFREDGTTDYISGGTYQFFPYQGTIIIYNASGAPMNILKVYNLTSERMLVGTPGSEGFSVWSMPPPVKYVEEIVLSETSLDMQPGDAKAIIAYVYPSDAASMKVEWMSSDETVAVVGELGGDIYVKAVANGNCVIICAATDGSGVKAECQVRVFKDYSKEYVDLGLPSGTLWATCNVGASSPQEYGDYFAWGEIKPKNKYNWSTYKWKNEGISIWGQINKYTFADGDMSACWYSNGIFIGDGKTELELGDDAATANWGSGWQMPSSEQINELINNNYTTREWTIMNGTNGLKITSKRNGKNIFLPAAGYYTEYSLILNEDLVIYWSRSLSTYSSICSDYLLVLDPSFHSDWACYDDYRFGGLSIRPVRVQE